jgi:hypothetical protein
MCRCLAVDAEEVLASAGEVLADAGEALADAGEVLADAGEARVGGWGIRCQSIRRQTSARRYAMQLVVFACALAVLGEVVVMMRKDIQAAR